MAEARDDGPAPLLLPAEARDRIVGLAAEGLSRLAPEELPVSLRAFARFTPTKRARLAAGPIAACLEADAVFRQRMAQAVRDVLPGLAEALAEGHGVPAAPPEDVAAVAYFVRPDGWVDHVARAGEQLAARASAAAGAATVDAVERLTEQLEAVRAAGRAQSEQSRLELAAARAETDAARREVTALRRRVRELGDRAARAERQAAPATVPAAAPADPADDGPGEPAATSAQIRRLRGRLSDAEAALAAARTASRDDRHVSDVRLRVLLDAVVGAASGLRRELALPPIEERPADAVAADYVTDLQSLDPPAQGRHAHDPVRLDALLCVPAVHLLVDGYNVTKTGYGEQALEAQRSRLLAGLAGLAARTGAEVTVVFDGVDRTAPLAAAGPRGVRLLFSRTGETADDVLRRLVRAEPAGRPLVVVTSDQAIVDDVRADGARPVPSWTLLRLLERRR